MNPILSRILHDRLIAVVRTDTPDVLNDVVRSLSEGGVPIIEITMTVPNAIEAIQSLVNECDDRVIIGAGTVTTANQAADCIRAGAKFIVSPIVAMDVIGAAKQDGVPVMSGAFTPTEVATAWQAGADVIKLFPADSLGPSYLKALRGPFPEIRLMPTGGVDLTTIPSWLQAGACCLGVGGSLVNASVIKNRDWQTLTTIARQYRAIVPILPE